MNDFTMLFGTGYPEPEYLYSGILQVRLGYGPGSVPGALLPGLGNIEPSNVWHFIDAPFSVYSGETGVYHSVSLIFGMLALKNAFGAPLPPAVGQGIMITGQE